MQQQQQQQQQQQVQYSLVSVQIPAGEQPICGVVIEPYILFKDEATNAVRAAHPVPDENVIAYGEQEGGSVLRSRWYRIHPDKDATLQCMLCLKSRVPQHLSYHCCGECLRAHWAHHRNYHERYLQQAQAHYMQNGGFENGYAYGYNGAGFIRNNDISSYESQVQQQQLPQLQESEWVEVGCERTYVPTLEDVGCILKYECSVIMAGSSKAPMPYSNGSYPNGTSSINSTDGGATANGTHKITTLTSRVKPAPSPPQRSMIPLSMAPRVSQEGRFTVLSYNLLADMYATQGDFHHYSCPAWAISWNYRRQNLIKELIRYRCDIMCLQEVQSNHYDTYLRDALNAHGYEGVYKKKTNDLFMGKCSGTDGCATFYRRDRFELIKKYEVEFNKAAVTTANHYPEPAKNAALQRLSKDNVAIIVVLESREVMKMTGDKPLVCVANTHIHSQRDHSDIKIWQVIPYPFTLPSPWMTAVVVYVYSTRIPIIVAGDFNSEPGSAAHTLIVSQHVDQRHPETLTDPAQFLQTMLPVRHSLPLCSAYAAILTAPSSKDNPGLNQQKNRMDPRTREPLFTNYTKTYKGTLDYIFYTPNLLSPTALLELPSKDEADIENGIPSARYSSDHICIMSEFQLNCSTYDPPL